MELERFKGPAGGNLAFKDQHATGSKPGARLDRGLAITASPSQQGESLALLGKDERVSVTARTLAQETISGDSAFWYRVRREDASVGWAFGAFLQLQ